MPSTNSPAAFHKPSFSRKLCSISAMHRNAVGGRLRALIHGVVADHAGDAQAVGGDDSGAALLLRLTVLLQRPPLAHAFIVLPELQREELALRGDAFESLERDESLGLVQLG